MFTERAILHSDLNSFYASVEMMLDPSLRGKAVAVCGAAEDRHGIVLAKSELAKKADVKTGMPVYHKCDRGDAIDVQWFRASASLPGVSRIVRIDGKELLDGGMCDAVPLDYFRSIGYEKNVVILTQPEEYRKGKNKLLPFLRLKLWNYPNMVHALATRHNRYNAQIAHINELGKKLPGEVLILKPKAPLNVAGIVREPERLMNAYNAGREVGLKNLERVKAFLKD